MLAIKKQSDNALAKEVVNEQLEMNWPGLAREVSDICKSIGAKDVCREDEIKEAVFYHHYAVMKNKMEDKVKRANMKCLDLRKPHPYLSSMCLSQARMAARLQLYMFRCPCNMSRLFRGRMTYKACVPWRQEEPTIVTQDHLIHCCAYMVLREEHLNTDPSPSFSKSRRPISFTPQIF